MLGGRATAPGVRPPAVAGTFYPRDPRVLRGEVERFLAEVPARGGRRPKALVVPHAGYVYSGPVAAHAYARLRAAGPPVERVVLLGPAHRVAVAGLALPEVGRFETPLGDVPIDAAAAERALRLPQVTRSDHAHLLEHSLEVQLPFLQAVLGSSFTLVPLAVGLASPDDVAGVLQALWGGPETLVVVSTDLSHYLPYAEARALDRRTAGQVLALDALGLHRDQACGRTPLQGLLLEARRRGLTAELLDLRSSGDTAGGPDEVVGYGAFALHEPAGAEEVEPGERRRRGRIVTGLARRALESLFGGPAPEAPDEPWLAERRACFVSLHAGGRLRGCVGAIEPRGPLAAEIVRCSRAAATEDGRFAPLTREELEEGIDLEVSVLGPAEPLPAADEAEALARLRPGVDGLVLAADGRSAVFIPAMWAQLPDPRDFLAQLRRKAGLPPGWLPGTRLLRFGAERYEEERS
ncbi:MAG TPA: AmmeMemoRadiSam system protein B [Anaeromyxobacteraceae bacterium]|nr:AmmeMemoRadiSam system protein B [Anaeromyxobacteraceae bacterium]